MPIFHLYSDEMSTINSCYKLLEDNMLSPGMVVHTCNPSFWEDEAGGSPPLQST